MPLSVVTTSGPRHWQQEQPSQDHPRDRVRRWMVKYLLRCDPVHLNPYLSPLANPTFKDNKYDYYFPQRQQGASSNMLPPSMIIRKPRYRSSSAAQSPVALPFPTECHLHVFLIPDKPIPMPAPLSDREPEFRSLKSIIWPLLLPPTCVSYDTSHILLCSPNHGPSNPIVPFTPVWHSVLQEQWATKEGLTHMYWCAIRRVGERHINWFPWPCMIHAPPHSQAGQSTSSDTTSTASGSSVATAKPITLWTLFHSISLNLHQYLSNEEFMSLSPDARQRASLAYEHRLQSDNPHVNPVLTTSDYGVQVDDDADATQNNSSKLGLKRIDWIGTNPMFYGMEPLENEQGWVVVVAPGARDVG